MELDKPSPQRYAINIGSGSLEQIGSLYPLGNYSQIIVVVDDKTPPDLRKRLLDSLPSGTGTVVIPGGDKHKNLANIEKIWRAAHAAGCDRSSLFINLGGGVIGDMGAFAASTYMRGVDFLNIPTTLLAQVDSSIGGKTAFNFDGVKNLIGSFRQPVSVIIDIETLASLPRREFTSAFGEIIKHGLIADADHFIQATAKRPAEFNSQELEDIIYGSCMIKLGIFKDDPIEKGARKLLHFGHAVGHAIEALSLETDGPLLHGEAVSLGMAAEATISANTGLLSSEDLSTIIQALNKAGLPTKIRGYRLEDVITRMRSGKNNTGGKLNLTLLEGLGHATYDHEVPESVVKEALRTVLG